MSTIWIIAGLCLLGVIVVLIGLWQRGDERADMGAVSSQWISEHRLGQNNDSRR